MLRPFLTQASPIIRPASLVLLAWLAGNLPAHGQGTEPLAMRERFKPGYQYHVSCRVSIKGQLIVPPETGQTQLTRIDVVGSSKIAYDERILAIKDGRIDRTVRYYQEMKFDRQAGKNEQRGTLRNAVRRLVILRHKQFEVPFSPDGPLLWDEIDMVRTNVFTPALNGLLPAGKVRPGDSWYADLAAVQELTDLEKITAGRLSCSFVSVTTVAGRSLASVAFKGRVKGIGEDGPAEHELDGHLLFDLASGHLSYLSVRGTQHLLDKAGKPSGGRVTGEFVLTPRRCPRRGPPQRRQSQGADTGAQRAEHAPMVREPGDWRELPVSAALARRRRQQRQTPDRPGREARQRHAADRGRRR